MSIFYYWMLNYIQRYVKLLHFSINPKVLSMVQSNSTGQETATRSLSYGCVCLSLCGTKLVDKPEPSAFQFLKHCYCTKHHLIISVYNTVHWLWNSAQFFSFTSDKYYQTLQMVTIVLYSWSVTSRNMFENMSTCKLFFYCCYCYTFTFHHFCWVKPNTILSFYIDIDNNCK